MLRVTSRHVIYKASDKYQGYVIALKVPIFSPSPSTWPGLPQLQSFIPASNDNNHPRQFPAKKTILEMSVEKPELFPCDAQEHQASSLKIDYLQTMVHAFFQTLKSVLAMLPSESPAHALSSALPLLEGLLY